MAYYVDRKWYEGGIPKTLAARFNPEGREVWWLNPFLQIRNEGRLLANKIPYVHSPDDDPIGLEVSQLRNKRNYGDRYRDCWDQRSKETTQEYRERLQSTLAVAVKAETCSKDAIKDLETRLKKIEGLN